MTSAAIRTFLQAGDRTLVSTAAGPVDVLQGLPQVPSFERLDTDATTVDLGDGLTIRVCSLEALLEMKRASDRPQDLADLQALDVAHDDVAHKGSDVPPSEPS